jgi:hypothetical protein
VWIFSQFRAPNQLCLVPTQDTAEFSAFLGVEPADFPQSREFFRAL